MTFYLKLKCFQAGNRQKYHEGKTYFLIIEVENKQKCRYKLTGDLIHKFQLDQKSPFLKLTSDEKLVSIKILEQDNYSRFTQVNYAKLNKQDLITEYHLKQIQNMQTVEHKLQFAERNQEMFKMMRENDYDKLVVVIKYDRYKKLMKRMNQDASFLRELGVLNKETVIQPGSIGSIVINRPQHLQSQKMVKEQPKKIKRKEMDFYLGPCQTKNVFSCLDPKINDQVYTIYEPQYEDKCKA